MLNYLPYWYLCPRKIRIRYGDVAKLYLVNSIIYNWVCVDRIFSTAGEILTNDRNRLKPKTAEILLILRKNMPKLQFSYDLKNKEQPLNSQDDTDV